MVIQTIVFINTCTPIGGEAMAIVAITKITGILEELGGQATTADLVVCIGGVLVLAAWAIRTSLGTKALRQRAGTGKYYAAHLGPYPVFPVVRYGIGIIFHQGKIVGGPARLAGFNRGQPGDLPRRNPRNRNERNDSTAHLCPRPKRAGA